MTAPRPVLAMVLAVDLLTIPLSAEAQPGAKIPRIGFLVGGSEGDPVRMRSAKVSEALGMSKVGTSPSSTATRRAGSSASPTSRPGWFASRST